jgi:hypothetical protein
VEASVVRGHRQRGQAALETMIVMGFLFTLIFGFVHICMFAATKSLTNYAAFTAARADLVGGNRNVAARQVMSEIQWWPGGWLANQSKVVVLSGQWGPTYQGGRRRKGVRVTYALPFGYPVFRGGLGSVRAVGFSPSETSHTGVPEDGDNK